jgi:hypothetical protein
MGRWLLIALLAVGVVLSLKLAAARSGSSLESANVQVVTEQWGRLVVTVMRIGGQ